MPYFFKVLTPLKLKISEGGGESWGVGRGEEKRQKTVLEQQFFKNLEISDSFNAFDTINEKRP